MLVDTSRSGEHLSTKTVVPPVSAPRRPAKAPLTEEQRALVEEHYALIGHVVYQASVHFPRHVDREELYGAGAMGLVDAAQRFEVERGVPFDRYAAQRIRGAILDSLRSADWAPRSVRFLARKLSQAEHDLTATLGRPPTIEESAAVLEVTPEEIHRMNARTYRSVVLALDFPATPTDTDGEATLGALLADEDAVDPLDELEHTELIRSMYAAIESLPERSRYVVSGYFLHGRPSLGLAADLGVTESRVSQIRSAALLQIREILRTEFDTDMDAEIEELLDAAAV